MRKIPKAFSIEVELGIPEIKSIFASSVEDVDPFRAMVSIPFKGRYKRRFVGRTDGSNLELRVIHYQYGFLTSPILRGRIESTAPQKSIIHFSFDYSVVYLLVIALILLFFFMMIFKMLETGQTQLPLISTLLGAILLANEVHNVSTRRKELKHFIKRIYEKYRVVTGS